MNLHQSTGHTDPCAPETLLQRQTVFRPQKPIVKIQESVKDVDIWPNHHPQKWSETTWTMERRKKTNPTVFKTTTQCLNHLFRPFLKPRKHDEIWLWLRLRLMSPAINSSARPLPRNLKLPVGKVGGFATTVEQTISYNINVPSGKSMGDCPYPSLPDGSQRSPD